MLSVCWFVVLKKADQHSVPKGEFRPASILNNLKFQANKEVEPFSSLVLKCKSNNKIHINVVFVILIKLVFTPT